MQTHERPKSVSSTFFPKDDAVSFHPNLVEIVTVMEDDSLSPFESVRQDFRQLWNQTIIVIWIALPPNDDTITSVPDADAQYSCCERIDSIGLNVNRHTIASELTQFALHSFGSAKYTVGTEIIQGSSIDFSSEVADEALDVDLEHGVPRVQAQDERRVDGREDLAPRELRAAFENPIFQLVDRELRLQRLVAQRGDCRVVNRLRGPDEPAREQN